MADENVMCTPINTITRENLTVLINNNIMLDNSLDFSSDCDMMETDSPVRKPLLEVVTKRLFHSPQSPMTQSSQKSVFIPNSNRIKKTKKRKQTLIPDSSEKIKKAYVKERDRDGYSPDLKGGMRKKVLISLFHNKEYSMDFS